MRTLGKDVFVQSEIPFVVDGSNEEVAGIMETFAGRLSATVIKADDSQKKKLHIAAVFTTNFVNHFYALIEDYCNKEDIDFKMLIPLIMETAGRVKNYSPSEVQTGPAARRDTKTIEKHLQSLEDHPHLRDLYLKITDSIMLLSQ